MSDENVESDIWAAVLGGAEPEPEWQPHVLDCQEDTSELTDEQVLECLALAGLPSWVQEAPALEPTPENVGALGRAFVGRRTPVPIRRKGRTWTAIDRKLEMDDFAGHLAGEFALGAYLVDDADEVGVVVLDIDTDSPLREQVLEGDWLATLTLACTARAVAWHMSNALGMGVLVGLSGGKGAHAIAPLAERSPAAIVRRQMSWCLRLAGLSREGQNWSHPDWPHQHIECYPKQDEAGDGLGNLIRLPHGRDPATGRPFQIITDGAATIPAQALAPMYGVAPRTERERSRRAIQEVLDGGVSDGRVDGRVLDAYLLHNGPAGMVERCLALIDTEVPQMANAVGQALWMARWYDQVHGAGLLVDLEVVADTLAGS